MINPDDLEKIKQIMHVGMILICGSFLIKIITIIARELSWQNY